MNEPKLEQFKAKLQEAIKSGADYVHPNTILYLVEILLEKDVK